MAKKRQRGNGAGTVYARKNKEGKITSYRGSYFTPVGKRRYISGKTKTAAERALRKATADRDSGLVFGAGSITLGEYLDRWLNDSVRDTVRQRTWERYEQISRVHLKPALGRVKLKLDSARGDRLEALNVLALYRGLREGELLRLKWDDLDLETGTLSV